MIRALALGEVTLRDWWRVMRREIGAGLALGSILGAIGFLRITVWSALPSTYLWRALDAGRHDSVAGAGRGCLVGHAHRIVVAVRAAPARIDPATSSAPFVATLVDVTGLVIYFSVGIVILPGTVL